MLNIISITLLFLISSSFDLDRSIPEELGKVQWLRDLEEAQAVSQQSGKPIFILFQEVPGCITCRNYGNITLSHPLIVETIETYFVPLAIFNNKGGKDADVMNFYKEPTWNNPVVRIVGPDKKDLQSRLNGNYNPSGLVKYMMSAMGKRSIEIPEYLSLLYDELRAMESGVEKATLSMFCFWTGEKELGKIDGVIQTEAGFMDSREVVNVYYDPSTVSLKDIIEEGRSTQCADQLYLSKDQQESVEASFIPKNEVKEASRFRLDKEPKYYLSKSVFQNLPMTPMQSVKINSLIGQGKSPHNLLSPGQIKMLKYLASENNTAWASSVNDPKWQDKMLAGWKAVKS